VYFINKDNQIIEVNYAQLRHSNRSLFSQRVYSGGGAGDWRDGALTTGKTKFYAASYSQLSVLGYGVGSNTLKVYYQDTQQQIREIILHATNERWYDGTHELPIAVAGTSLSASSLAAH
jgi:hypothetical protein